MIFYGQVLSLQHKGNKNLLTFGGGWNRYDGNHFWKNHMGNSRRAG
jgi:hypothetical protein